MSLARAMQLGCLAVALAAVHVGAARAADVVATERAASRVVAHGSTAAWSSLQADGRYVVKAYGSGRVWTLPIRARKVAFDLDLGPDSKGRLTAVYSRCAKEGRGVARGCKLYRYRFSGGGESRITGVSRRSYSEDNPTIWHTRIAFARHRDQIAGDEFTVDRLFLRNRGGRIRQLPRGTLRLGVPGEAATDAAASRLDLRGHTLAFSWTYLRPAECRTPHPDPNDPFAGFAYQTQIWLVSITSRRLIDSGCEHDQRSVYSPSLHNSRLSYQRTAPGPINPFGASERTVLRTVNPRGQIMSTRELPLGINSSAVTSSMTVLSRAIFTDTDPVVATYEISVAATPAAA